MKEIYVRTKLVNGTYVYAPKGTKDTYGTVLIDNDTLKYYNDVNDKDKSKLKVNGAALIDNYTLISENGKLKVDATVINNQINEELWNEINKKLDKTDAEKNFASLVNGKVPASQLPSYVDDVLEYDSKNDFPATGETGKIYVDKSTNLTYRWINSNNYIMIGGGDLNIENGTGIGSLVQKRLRSDGVTWTTTKAYQGASTALGGGTQAGRTEEEFNAYFWDSVNNVPLHDGQGKDSNGNILDNYGLTYAQSYSFALATGDYTKALGRSSHAEGNDTQAIGIHSHAEGLSTKAEGYAAHTEGTYTEAYYKGSHAEGDHTKTSREYQHVGGTYNDYYKYNALYIVGNGTSETDRRNAFEVLQDGRAKVQSAPVDSNDVVRKQELDNSWNEFNLENGTGLDSIVQKYSGTVDATHFASSTTGERDVCLGEANKSTGKRNIIVGKLNENAGSNNLIGGLFNVCKSNHCLLSGEGINIGENRRHKSAIGRYNVDKSNTLLEVGNGNNTANRSNAFEVYADGRAKVQSAPVEDDDVVRLSEVAPILSDYVDDALLGG